MNPDETQDLLGISERIEKLQFARLMVTTGRNKRALEILESIQTAYEGKDEAKHQEVQELIAKVREALGQ